MMQRFVSQLIWLSIMVLYKTMCIDHTFVYIALLGRPGTIGMRYFHYEFSNIDVQIRVLQLSRHSVLPNLSEIPPNQNVTRFVLPYHRQCLCSLCIFILNMWSAPKVFLSNQVDHNISAKITKPSKNLGRTLVQKCFHM